jgi:hypothetical protein
VDRNSIAAHLPEVTGKGFKICYISNSVDVTDDDVMRGDHEEDGNIGSECELDEGTDCEDGDSDTDW